MNEECCEEGYGYAGYGYGPRTATQKADNVQPSPLASLQSAQDHLHDVISKLESRLTPILGPNFPASEEKSEQSETAIFVLLATTEAQIHRLETLLSRIEL